MLLEGWYSCGSLFKNTLINCSWQCKFTWTYLNFLFEEVPGKNNWTNQNFCTELHIIAKMKDSYCFRSFCFLKNGSGELWWVHPTSWRTNTRKKINKIRIRKIRLTKLKVSAEIHKKGLSSTYHPEKGFYKSVSKESWDNCSWAWKAECLIYSVIVTCSHWITSKRFAMLLLRFKVFFNSLQLIKESQLHQFVLGRGVW